MGAHQNVHSLLGYCLETDLPVLIYEWIGSETLAERVIDNEKKNKPPLEWKDRLRIACEISNAIACLHTAFPRPIIHKDLKPATVFLTPDNTAKVFDFSLSVLIPDGEDFVQPDKLIGYFPFLAPECVMEGRVAKSSDVYAFGMLFLVLLTGKASIFSLTGEGDTEISLVCWVKEGIEKNCINEIVEPFIISSKVTNSELLDQQLRALIKLALRCTEKDEGKRPTMMEIGTELQNMMKSLETVS
ncbi:serine/threonine-protein kinase ZRK1-like [Amaranthus tricolor]|uniref:serine/threonine-protein kinase ZRK1-like n=1 Tax=Amaranthus tricolor TaxID=29722 RepID=UPI0025855DCB|nr:serine/threonine-protein kinase ZRK1-like [Amaranthus tricolor]